jgi:hypothetical protein
MDQRDRRGQLLLVAALGLAVAFVALALVLNAVVFTENLATRNHGQTGDTLGYERAVEDSAAALLVATNVQDNADYVALRDAFAAGVGTWDGNASVLSAASGQVSAVSVTTVSNGTRVVQAEARNFSNASNEAAWQAADGVSSTRRFHVVATPTDGTTPLTWNVTDGTAEWEVRILENASNTSQTDVVVRNATVELSETTVPADTVRVDLTAGTVNGSAVANWTFAEGLGTPYDVYVDNGGSANGRYVFVVNTSESPFRSAVPGAYHSASDDAFPKTTPALFSATLAVDVRDSRVVYASNVTLAPESAVGPTPGPAA